MAANAEDLSRQIRAIEIAQGRLTETWLIEQAVYPGHVDTLHRLVSELYEMTDRRPPAGYGVVVSDVVSGGDVIVSGYARPQREGPSR
jgi:hypothetical protein